MMQWRGQRYFVERTFQDEKSEMGWDELVAQKYRAWVHHAALAALALYFVMSVRRQWVENYPRSEELKEELGIAKLPALSVANIRELLAAVMPLRQFTPAQAVRVVIGHLENRARSTHSRRCKQSKNGKAFQGELRGPSTTLLGPHNTRVVEKSEALHIDTDFISICNITLSK